MSAIDEVLNQFLAEGASGDWFARCDDARREIDNLRAENEAMRNALRELLGADEAWWHGQGDPRDSSPLLLRMDDARLASRAALARKDTP